MTIKRKNENEKHAKCDGYMKYSSFAVLYFAIFTQTQQQFYSTFSVLHSTKNQQN